MGNAAEPKVYSVSELTRVIKGTLESAFGRVWVQGELSNVRRPVSGHLYFTVKDAAAQIRAVLFRGDRRGASFDIQDGQLVRVWGDVTVYERQGEYQLVVRRIERAGKGALFERFEALKEKLRQEGLFDEARKKPLPRLPQHVGVVTSPTGAAIRDILNIITRRFPNLHVAIVPVKVQGEGAAGEIAAAVDLFNALGGFDVLIVGRGGGSFEDLWCFNEEIVARAIARSAIPVISAVGHETDFTISDFVADLRAPTPSAAAELVVESKEAFEERLASWAARLSRAAREILRRSQERLAASAGHYVFREPRHAARQYRQTLAGWLLRMEHAVRGRMQAGQQRTDDLAMRLLHEVSLRRQASAHDVERLSTQLRALNPLAVLQRGYSVTRRGDGRIVRDAAELSAGERLVTRVARGSFASSVLGAEESKHSSEPEGND